METVARFSKFLSQQAFRKSQQGISNKTTLSFKVGFIFFWKQRHLVHLFVSLMSVVFGCF